MTGGHHFYNVKNITKIENNMRLVGTLVPRAPHPRRSVEI